MRKLMYVREHQIEKFFVQECKARGWLCWKFVSPGLRGVPDRIVFMPSGKCVFVEVKAPGEKPTPQQLRRHEELRALGFQVWVLDSKPTVWFFIETYA